MMERRESLWMLSFKVSPTFPFFLLSSSIISLPWVVNHYLTNNVVRYYVSFYKWVIINSSRFFIIVLFITYCHQKTLEVRLGSHLMLLPVCKCFSMKYFLLHVPHH